MSSLSTQFRLPPEPLDGLVVRDALKILMATHNSPRTVAFGTLANAKNSVLHGEIEPMARFYERSRRSSSTRGKRRKPNGSSSLIENGWRWVA
jgi:hypothetical protein